MLKTKRNGEYWLVSQPDHAWLSGTLAAYWGTGEFRSPGHFAPFGEPERLRAETVLAIAEHDNGWWEWEAAPPLAEDGLPRDLRDVLNDQQEAMKRWRLGVPRLRELHPYASLLISYHANWLYAPKAGLDAPAKFSHSVTVQAKEESEETASVRDFLSELSSQQAELATRVKSTEFSEALAAAHLDPHIRLLQLADAMSLALCSTMIRPAEGNANGFGEDVLRFDNTPRSSAEDVVSITWEPAGERQIVCRPYPFCTDPLEVHAPVRIVAEGAAPAGERFHSWWQTVGKQPVRYELRSRPT